MLRPVKIFFDVDGVLIDGWHADPARRKAWDADLQRDLGIDRAAFQHRFFGQGPERQTALMLQCVSGALRLEDALAETLAGMGHDIAVEDFIAYWFEKDSQINRPVFEIVAALKGKPGVELFVATGQEHRRAAYLWDRLGFRHQFRKIFYSAAIGCLKKDLAFFASINKALSITEDDAPIFFDDQPEIVALARAVGWDAYVFNEISDLTGNPRIREILSVEP